MLNCGSNVGGTDITKFRVRADGNCENTNNSYGAISDARLKENVTSYGSDCLEDVEYLSDNLVKYNLIGDSLSQIGLIAQTAMTQCPGLVDEGTDGYYSVKYSIINLKLLRAVGSLIKKNRELESRLSTLEAALPS